MPQPRKARPKRLANDTRARSRHIRKCLWVYHQLEERFAYVAELVEQKRQHAAKEKAPGLATGGSSNVVIPGEDPGPPETQTLAEVPARHATPRVKPEGWPG